MKRLFAIILFVIMTMSELIAGGPLLKAVQEPTVMPPTRANVKVSYPTCLSATNVFKCNIYTDIQCTKTIPAEEGLVRAVFASKGNYRLVYVPFDAFYGNFFVCQLFLADSQGNILDNLEVEVQGVSAIVIKDYVIENGVIKVYSIKPTSAQSLAFEDFGVKFTSFTGTRCDEEYIVDGNKFKLTKRITYSPVTYTYNQIYAGGKYTFKIWNGTETVSRVQNF